MFSIVIEKKATLIFCNYSVEFKHCDAHTFIAKRPLNSFNYQTFQNKHILHGTHNKLISKIVTIMLEIIYSRKRRKKMISCTKLQADQICYSVLCVFSYLAAGLEQKKQQNQQQQSQHQLQQQQLQQAQRQQPQSQQRQQAQQQQTHQQYQQQPTQQRAPLHQQQRQQQQQQQQPQSQHHSGSNVGQPNQGHRNTHPDSLPKHH